MTEEKLNREYITNTMSAYSNGPKMIFFVKKDQYQRIIIRINNLILCATIDYDFPWKDYCAVYTYFDDSTSSYQFDMRGTSVNVAFSTFAENSTNLERFVELFGSELGLNLPIILKFLKDIQ